MVSTFYMHRFCAKQLFVLAQLNSNFAWEFDTRRLLMANVWQLSLYSCLSLLPQHIHKAFLDTDSHVSIAHQQLRVLDTNAATCHDSTFLDMRSPISDQSTWEHRIDLVP